MLEHTDTNTNPMRSFEDADVVFVPGLFARGDPYTEQQQHKLFLNFFTECAPHPKL